LRKHLQETLCSENLLFFVDVYMHRKNLDEDPFLELLENESSIIKDLAKLEMKWIDSEVEEKPWTIPSSKDIYHLYIKPLSELEVNIPGDMRREIISEFERTTTRVSILGPINANSNSKCVQMTPKRMKRATSTPIPAKFIERQTNNKVSSALSRTSAQPSISYLYPVWNTLVKLIMNDSLVRFRALRKWKRKEIKILVVE